MEAMWTRFFPAPATKKVKELVTSHAIGDIQYPFFSLPLPLPLPPPFYVRFTFFFLTYVPISVVTYHSMRILQAETILLTGSTIPIWQVVHF